MKPLHEEAAARGRILEDGGSVLRVPWHGRAEEEGRHPPGRPPCSTAAARCGSASEQSRGIGWGWVKLCIRLSKHIRLASVGQKVENL